MTLPIILLLQRTDATVLALVQSVVTDRGVSAEGWRTIRDLLTRHHAVDAAYERAVTYGDRAKRGLIGAFPPSVERESLVALTDYVLNRDR